MSFMVDPLPWPFDSCRLIVYLKFIYSVFSLPFQGVILLHSYNKHLPPPMLTLFIAALMTVAKVQDQRRCLSLGDWIITYDNEHERIIPRTPKMKSWDFCQHETMRRSLHKVK